MKRSDFDTQLAHQFVNGSRVRVNTLRNTALVHHLLAILEQLQLGNIQETGTPLLRQRRNHVSIIVIGGGPVDD